MEAKLLKSGNSFWIKIDDVSSTDETKIMELVSALWGIKSPEIPTGIIPNEYAKTETPSEDKMKNVPIISNNVQSASPTTFAATPTKKLYVGSDKDFINAFNQYRTASKEYQEEIVRKCGLYIKKKFDAIGNDIEEEKKFLIEYQGVLSKTIAGILKSNGCRDIKTFTESSSSKNIEGAYSTCKKQIMNGLKIK